jgi:CheY-like chemotaxis protein
VVNLFANLKKSPDRDRVALVPDPARPPVVDEELALDARLLEAARKAPGEHILIVDDEDVSLRAAALLVERLGYVPFCTRLPDLTVQLARSLQPRAILLDLLMPEFDGWDVLGALKADAVVGAIPVYMISVLAEHRRAVEAGAKGLLIKPLRLEALSAVLGSIGSDTAVAG